MAKSITQRYFMREIICQEVLGNYEHIGVSEKLGLLQG